MQFFCQIMMLLMAVLKVLEVLVMTAVAYATGDVHAAWKYFTGAAIGATLHVLIWFGAGAFSMIF